MLSIFDPLRNITFSSMVFRMVLAAVCSGIIGLERTLKNRPAGLRTHILVCLAATTASMTGHFLYLNLHLPTDMTRMGAQIISGLGFLGAGTIIVTSRQMVKGLTTAASLWATGIIGLVIGAGFYEGGIITSILVFLTLELFSNAGYNAPTLPEISFSITYNHKNALDSITHYFERKGLAITYLKVSGDTNEDPRYKALISVRPHRNIKAEDIIEHLRSSGDSVTVIRIDPDDIS